MDTICLEAEKIKRIKILENNVLSIEKSNFFCYLMFTCSSITVISLYLTFKYVLPNICKNKAPTIVIKELQTTDPTPGTSTHTNTTIFHKKSKKISSKSPILKYENPTFCNTEINKNQVNYRHKMMTDLTEDDIEY